MASDAPPGNGKTNGNGQPGLVHAGLRIVGQVTQSLAPQFLALVIVNLMFLGGLFWFVDARAKHTASVLNQLLNVCVEDLQQRNRGPK